MKKISCSNFQYYYRDALSEAANGVRVLVTWRGKPFAALVSPEDLKKLEATEAGK